MECFQLIVGVFWLPLLILLPTVHGQRDCPMLQESQLGNTSMLSSEGLLAETLRAESGGDVESISVLIQDSNTVCLGQGTVRDTYRSASVVVRYFAGTVEVVQVEYQCTNGEWGVDSNSSVTFNPEGTLSTELRTDCSLCTKPDSSTGSVEASAEEHCISCTSNCTGLMRCAGPQDAACCNYFDMTGSCVPACPNNSSPSNLAFQCQCLPGYMLTDSGNNCSDIDECQPDPCENGGTCMDLIDNFSCECAPGFIGDNCTSIDDCSPNPCRNGGSCTDLVGNFSCHCLQHWSGRLCDTCSLLGCANCSVEMDQNRSICLRCIDGFVLSGNFCIPGSGLYFILDGTVYLPGDTVLLTDIGEFTSPSEPGTSLVCVTSNVNTQCCRGADGGNVGEWFFPDGTVVIRNSVDRSANFSRSGFTQQVRLNRRNNATSPTGAFECRVPNGSTGMLVTASITTDINECTQESDNCDTNAACANTPDSFTCTCNQGYSGDGVTCADIDECATGADICVTNTACGNTPGSFTCTCNQGYSGDGVICVDIDECTLAADNCDTNAACANTPGSFTCTCNQGYGGNGVTCVDVDECTTNADNCDTNAVCVNSHGSFTCVCSQGYSGDGITCLDIDECATGNGNCDTNAACGNTPGSFTCTCNQGYSGDGVCMDIDECATGDANCDADASCANTPGSFTCTCNQGYSGDGITCVDIDECAIAADNCDTNAACANIPGNFTCTCNQGYIGDGVTCMECNITSCSTCSDDGLCRTCDITFTLTSESRCEPEANIFPIGIVTGVVVGLVAMILLIVIVILVGLACMH